MFKRFSQRSFTKELLDKPDIPFEDIKLNLKELDTINSYLGGYKATTFGLNQLLNSSISEAVIADIGCGGGDNLIRIAKWCSEKGINVDLIGVDIKKECIDYAKERSRSYPNIRYILSDYKLVEESFDIVHCSLFTHHLDDNQLEHYLKWSTEKSKIGVIINDLHRNFLAYYSIKLLTQLFSKSDLVRNDASLSVLRSFRASEWKEHAQNAGLNCKVFWIWAFRYVTIIKS